MKHLIGENNGWNLSMYDCYVREKFGIFIPILQEEGTVAKEKRSYPSYEIVIDFSMNSQKAKHYCATITSPGVAHYKATGMHCYLLYIEKEYFEKKISHVCTGNTGI